MSKKYKIRVLLIIFCEGESDNESSLTSTVAAIPGRNADATIAKIRNGRVNCSNGLVGQTGLLVDHIGLIKLISHDGHICITFLVSFINLICLGFVRRNEPIGLSILNGLSTLADCWIIDLVGQISLVNLSGISGISDCICHNGLIGLVSLIGLVGFGNFGIISSSASLDSAVLSAYRLIGLVGLLALPQPISLVGSSTSANCWIIGLVFGSIGRFGILIGFAALSFIIGLVGLLISLVGIVGLVGLIGLNSLGGLVSIVGIVGLVGLAGIGGFSNLSFVSFIGLCYHRLCNNFVAAIIVAATAISRLLKHAVTCGVATLFAAVLCNCNCLAAPAATTTWWLNYTASHRVAALINSASEIVNTATVFFMSPHHFTFVRS
jgi:hypothetical protein